MCFGLWVLFTLSARAAYDPCGVCGKEIEETVTTWEDRITHTKKRLCSKCTELPNNCFLCSLPLLKNYKTLPDGRTICERDAHTVIFDDGEAAEICAEVQSELERQFLRFVTFPETNVTITLMDRITLQEIFKVIGTDYTCPNAIGCTETRTNGQSLFFKISLLSGLPREQLITTCVHEFGHAWINENLEPTRRKAIGKDAVEGFCELLSYLFAKEHGYQSGVAEILVNAYTRGQIHLFIAAEQQFGFNEIVDWMKYGEDATLRTNELARIRRVDLPPITKSAATLAPVYYASAPPVPMATLKLNGIIWSKTRPMASVNHKSFAVNDEAMVLYGETNIMLRCLAIREDSVTMRDLGTGQEIKLQLRGTSHGTNQPAIPSGGN